MFCAVATSRGAENDETGNSSKSGLDSFFHMTVFTHGSDAIQLSNIDGSLITFAFCSKDSCCC
jgi:hypothetical protein